MRGPGRGRPLATLFLVAGGACLGGGALLPFVGRPLLDLVRSRPIRSQEAIGILPDLLLLGAGAAAFVGALFVSTGLLLGRGEAWNRLPAAPRRGPERAGRRGAVVSAGLVAVLAVGFGLAQLRAAGRSFTFDEVSALETDVKGPWTSALSPRAWINHISGGLLARAGRALFGESERGLRLPAVALGVGGMAALGAWTLRTTGSSAATALAMIAVGGNPLLFETTLQIRGYAPLVWAGLLCVMASLALVEARPKSRSAWTAALAFAAVLTTALLLGLSHLFGLIYLAILAGLVHVGLWIRRDGGAPAFATAASLAVAVAVAIAVSLPAFPWLLYFRSQGPSAAEAAGRTWRVVEELFVGRTGAPSSAMAMAGLEAFGAAWLWRRRPNLRALVLLAIGPLYALLLLGMLARPTFFYARFLLLGAALGALLPALAAGESWSAPRPSGRRNAFEAALLLSLVAALYAPGLEDRLAGDRGYREALAEAESVLAVAHAPAVGGIVPAGSDASRKIIRHYASDRAAVSEQEGARILAGERPVRGKALLFVAEETDPGADRRLTPPSALPAWSLEIPGPRDGSPVRILGFEPLRRPTKSAMAEAWSEPSVDSGAVVAGHRSRKN